MFPSNRLQRRRAATAVFVLVTLPVLLGMAALTVDVAVLCNVRADLQNSADAAALAAASSLSSSAMQKVRAGTDTAALSEMQSLAANEVNRVAELNHSFGVKSTLITQSDTAFGWIDLTSATSPVESGGNPVNFNAVHVTARRSSQSSNAPVSFFFAPIFGKHYSNVSADAVAAFDDRVSGYDQEAGNAVLWPMTVSLEEFNLQLANKVDQLDFESATTSISSGGDGLPEVDVYPMTQAPGNFGLLNIGIGNEGATGVSGQLEDGVTAEALEAEIGESSLSFVNADGTQKTHLITGNPGIKSAVETSIEKHIGEVVAITVHDQVTMSGANATYRIIGVRFVRVMSVSLKSGQKYLWVQPTTYVGPGITTHANAPSSGGAAGTFVLVR